MVVVKIQKQLGNEKPQPHGANGRGKSVWFASPIESDSLQWGNKPNSAAATSKPPSFGVDTGHSVRTALVFVVEFAAVRCPCDTVLGIRVDASHSGRAGDPARRPAIDPQQMTAPLPAALDGRGISRHLLHHPRRQQLSRGLCLLRVRVCPYALSHD